MGRLRVLTNLQSALRGLGPRLSEANPPLKRRAIRSRPYGPGIEEMQAASLGHGKPPRKLRVRGARNPKNPHVRLRRNVGHEDFAVMQHCNIADLRGLPTGRAAVQ